MHVTASPARPRGLALMLSWRRIGFTLGTSIVGRMPDRLQFALNVDDAARALRCPPMTLLTLVENAVRHGIDPSEEGGRIDVLVQRRGDRGVVRVSDTGTGLKPANGGLGTGLSTLRERLQLTFGGDAELLVASQRTSGVSSELELPTRDAGD